MTLLGLRAAARELGISHPALLKHEKRGAVKRRNPDGLFDVEDCRKSLAENCRSSRRAQHTEKPSQPPPGPVLAIRPTPPPVSDHDDAEQESLSLSPPDAAAGPTPVSIQTERDLLKLERERISFEAFKGTLVDAAKTKAAITARAAEEREALLNWPSRISADLAAELNVDERTLYAALEKQIRAYLGERSRAPVSLSTDADA